MSGADVDKVFAGSIPRLYEEYLVPLIFAPYAEDLAGRVAGLAAPCRRIPVDIRSARRSMSCGSATA